MITKTFNTTAGKLQVSIPEQIEEISLGQLMDMQSAENMSDLDAIHILSGVPIVELQSIKNFNDLQQFNAHIVKLSEQIKEVYDSDSIPKNICFNIDGKAKSVKVISNLALEPAGAFLAARDVITDEISNHIASGELDWKETFNPSLKACTLILAHYLYCAVTGKSYNEYEAERFTDEIKKLPFTEALPIAKYFFELSKLIETENKLLASRATAMEEKAGIMQFQKFGYVNTINSLAGGDITKWHIVLNLPYNMVLTKLLLNKAEADYQKRYMELNQ